MDLNWAGSPGAVEHKDAQARERHMNINFLVQLGLGQTQLDKPSLSLGPPGV